MFLSSGFPTRIMVRLLFQNIYTNTHTHKPWFYPENTNIQIPLQSLYVNIYRLPYIYFVI